MTLTNEECLLFGSFKEVNFYQVPCCKELFCSTLEAYEHMRTCESLMNPWKMTCLTCDSSTPCEGSEVKLHENSFRACPYNPIDDKFSKVGDGNQHIVKDCEYWNNTSILIRAVEFKRKLDHQKLMMKES